MKNTIKILIQITANIAAVIAAYKLGRNSGYEDGWNDVEMAGGCKGCAMSDEKRDSCADIPDFDRIYS